MTSRSSVLFQLAKWWRGSAFLPALLLILAVALAVRYWLLQTHATEEDFYITLRYATNIAAGRGFVYNPGEPVLGTTTPLYTLLLAFLIRMHLDPVLVGKWLGIGADLLSCIAVFWLGKRVERPAAGLAAALCVALLPTNLIWATKGMEVELVAAMAAVAWAAWADGRELLAWGAAAVLALLRIDGAALAILLLLASLVRTRCLPWRGLLLFAILTLPWLVYATNVFGSPVPVSLQAKLIVYGRGQVGYFPRLLPFLMLMTHRQGSLLALGVVFTLCGFLTSMVNLSRLYPSRRDSMPAIPAEWLLIPPALWISAHYAGMALSKVFLFGWYFVPPSPIYYLIAMTGWSLLLQRVQSAVNRAQMSRREDTEAAGYTKPGAVVLADRNGRVEPLANATQQTRCIILVTGITALLLVGIFVPGVRRDLRRTQDTEDGLRIPIGLWLKAHGRPTDQVMLEPIGYIGYYSGLRVLDTVALVSPQVLASYDPRITSPCHAIWTRFAPEWILLRAGEWDDLQHYEASLPPSQRLPAHYHAVISWSDPASPQAGPAFFLFARQPVREELRRK